MSDDKHDNKDKTGTSPGVSRREFVEKTTLLTGGALLGYGVRARQNRLSGKSKLIGGTTVRKIPDAEKAEILLPPVKE